MDVADLEEKRYWVGFNLVKGIGAARMRLLLDAFGDARSAWQAPVEQLLAAGLGPKLVETFVKLRANVSLDAVWERIVAQGIQVFTWQDEAYPARLAEIPQPPPVIYARGSLLSEDAWAVAVVGTRRVTSYGRQVAEEIATSLARSGITVVSGLARGVDAVAHLAALQAGGRSLAVLGCGVDRIYPPENRRLAEQLIEHGALISDYAPGTAPDSANFPPRNRIISGLVKAVIVVEAGKTSGALITAAFAAEQGREVFAVPGSIYAPQSVGTNLLLQQGARPYLNCQDVLAVLNLAQVTEQRSLRASIPVDPVEARLYAALSLEPLHIDEIRRQADLPIEKVSAALVMMELKGLVRQVGGMQYIAVREASEPYEIE
ncbi:MAG: DNA-processing protein DprA [Anaerolineales bacterium]|nr:DNA-processing protein DprA [Anaerolineales bacterium]